MPAAIQHAPRGVSLDVADPKAWSTSAVLRLDVVATSHVLARITSIIARRRFEVTTMDISEPAGGRRRITMEVDAADEIRLQQLVKFLNQSPDVVKVVRLTGERSHVRRSAFVTVAAPADRLADVIGIARAWSAEIVDAGQAGCTLFMAAEPARVDALVRALEGFTIREVVTATPLRISNPPRNRQDPRARPRKGRR